MDAKERATKFVNKHPGMFKENKDYWITQIAIVILEAEREQLRNERKTFLATMNNAKV